MDSADGRPVLLRRPFGRLPGRLVILLAWVYVYRVARSYGTSEPFADGYVYAVCRLVYVRLQRYFVDDIGDIEVYVTRDSKSARFTAREQRRRRAVR